MHATHQSGLAVSWDFRGHGRLGGIFLQVAVDELWRLSCREEDVTRVCLLRADKTMDLGCERYKHLQDQGSRFAICHSMQQTQDACCSPPTS